MVDPRFYVATSFHLHNLAKFLPENMRRPRPFSAMAPGTMNDGGRANAQNSSIQAPKESSDATKIIFDDDGTSHASTMKAQRPNDAGIKYIVFVGNMSYDVTAEDLAKHMGDTCGETPKVRLLTKKGDPSALEKLSNSKKKSIAKGKAQDPSAPVSKGCAFVEFSNAASLQKALRFHHTTFRGRQINVELTAGGGGKSERRKEKIKAKNAGLDKERQKLFEKYVKPEAEAHKRKQVERSEEAPEQSKHDKTTRPTKRPKFASGANAVRLG